MTLAQTVRAGLAKPSWIKSLGLIGLVSAVIGWGVDLWLNLSGGNVAWAKGSSAWSPALGASFVVLYSLALGAFIEVLKSADRSVQQAAGGRARRGHTPIVVVFLLCFAGGSLVLLLLLTAAAVAQWIYGSFDRLLSWVDVIFANAGIAAGGGAALACVIGSITLAERIVLPLLARHWALWLTYAVAASAFLAFGVLTPGFIGIVLLSKAALAANLPSPMTTGSMLALLGPGVWIFWRGVRRDLAEREDLLLAISNNHDGVDMHGDFRKWQIKAETSCDGKDQDGFPFYVWRESADNRLGLSRPRNCCIEERDGQLCFVFYNPIGNIQSTGATQVAILVPVALLGWVLFNRFVSGPPRSSGALAFMDNPIGGEIIGALVIGTLMGMVAGLVWRAIALALRWEMNRFAKDGSLTVVPLAALAGFNLVSAADTGATVNGKPARSGYGMEAVLASGGSIVLTHNPWTRESLVQQHSRFNELFLEGEAVRALRDAVARREREMRRSQTSAARDVGSRSGRDAPDRL